MLYRERSEDFAADSSSCTDIEVSGQLSSQWTKSLEFLVPSLLMC